MPPKRSKSSVMEAQVEPQSAEENGNPQIQRDEETEEPVLIASEGENIQSSKDFEKWKLEQEFKLKEKELEI